MRRSLQIVALLMVVGMISLSYIPATQARADTRPIDDWLVNNFNVWAFWDFENYLATCPHGIPWWSSLLWGFEEHISDCEYHGFVLEKPLENGDIEYTINLHVKDAWLPIRYVWDWPDIIIVGTTDYLFQLKFILKASYPGGTGDLMIAFKMFHYDIPAGNRELGGELPWLLFMYYIPDVIGVQITSLSFTANGIGEFTDFAANYGFTPGATVQVNIQTRCICHPLKGDFCPVQFIEFHEIG